MPFSASKPHQPLPFFERTGSPKFMSPSSAGHVVQLECWRGNQVHISCIGCASGSELRLEEFAPSSFLGMEELAYLSNLRYERRRLSFLLGRLAAKRAMCRFLGVSVPQRVQVLSGVFGQPIATTACEGKVDISITHCGDIGLAIAFSPHHPMSIDLEIGSEAVAQTSRHYLPAGELSVTEGLAWPEPMRCVLLWSARECLSKVLRCGLAVPPNVLAVSSVQSAGLQSAVAHFDNFPQYKCHTAYFEDRVLSILIPRESCFADEATPALDVLQNYTASNKCVV